jgi:hypothetical protein
MACVLTFQTVGCPAVTRISATVRAHPFDKRGRLPDARSRRQGRRTAGLAFRRDLGRADRIPATGALCAPWEGATIRSRNPVRSRPEIRTSKREPALQSARHRGLGLDPLHAAGCPVPKLAHPCAPLAARQLPSDRRFPRCRHLRPPCSWSPSRVLRRGPRGSVLPRPRPGAERLRPSARVRALPHLASNPMDRLIPRPDCPRRRADASSGRQHFDDPGPDPIAD